MHLPAAISDLALILIVAGVVTVVFRWLQQPLVLGYLVAGILVGPQVRFLPTVTEVENMKTWAELGVIFLFYVLGLEFSFKRLFRVGKPAAITATFEVALMLGIGYVLGRVLNWSNTDALFLGAALSISSTTIIVKAFEELGVKSQLFATTVVGVLVIEDLYAILILAVLSTIAATQTFQGSELLFQVGKLAAFILVFVPLGLWGVPKLLRLLHRQLNDETRVVISVGACLGCVLLATSVGFSPALGAFLTGAIIAETLEGERLERILKPVRDLFGAVFFTTVGMMVDLNVLIDNWGTILLLSLVAIGGKIATTIAGMIVGGSDKKLALQTGLSLAQIGEFSFIIVTLGLTLKVIRPELYPLTVAVSVITTFATPYLIRLALLQRKTRARRAGGASQCQQLWEGHVVELDVHPHYTKAGQTLEQLKLREKFGVTVVSIYRGERNIISPTRHDALMPHDRLMVFGADSQLMRLAKHFRSERYSLTDVDESAFGMERLRVSDRSSLLGKSILQSRIRELVGGVILGIERNGVRHLNPDSNFVIQQNDELWVYGNLEKLRQFSVSC